MTFHKKTVTAALQASSPVFFGYISIGFAYGFLLVKAGLPWFYAPVMCIIVFAGAAQFMAIGLLLGDKSPLEIGLAIFFVNARHMVYGLSLLERFKPFKKFKHYLIYGLTDETYALLTTLESPSGCLPEVYDFWITAFNQSYWFLGSLLGALLGTVVSFSAPGLDFALTALFIVLTIEQVKAIKRFSPFILPILTVVCCLITGFTEDMLITTILISSIGCFFLTKPETEEEQ